MHITTLAGDMGITNIYAPNSPTKSYYQDLTVWLSSLVHTHHIVGGDFNSVMLEAEDRSRAISRNTKRMVTRNNSHDSRSPSQLGAMVDATRLQDLWSLTHPTDREFTHILCARQCGSLGLLFWYIIHNSSTVRSLHP